MRPCAAQDGDPIAMLAKWYKGPLGRRVAAAEAGCVAELMADAFGLYMLQIGCAAQFADTLTASRVRQRVVLGDAPCTNVGDAQVLGSPYAWPMGGASVDLVLLPHTLDFCVDPHRVLREAERVLIPEGRLLVLCFNPLSPWGLVRALPRRRRRVPWCGGQLSPLRLGDWLRLLGFTVEARRILVFRPPFIALRGDRGDWLEGLGARWWPWFGGVYLVSAVKRVSAPTPLRPGWARSAPFLPGGALKPTAREKGCVRIG